MALSYPAIQQVRRNAYELVKEAAAIKTAVEQFDSILKNDGNYFFFVTGTDKGTSVDRKLKNSLSLLVEDLVPTIKEIQPAMESYCIEQEELNREEARKKMEQMNSEPVTEGPANPAQTPGSTSAKMNSVPNYIN